MEIEVSDSHLLLIEINTSSNGNVFPQHIQEFAFILSYYFKENLNGNI